MLCGLRRSTPVPWLQDLHSVPAIRHPAWLNVNSVFRRFTRVGGWCRLRLLNNNNLLIVESITTKKFKAVKVVGRERSSMNPGAGPANHGKDCAMIIDEPA